MAFLRPDDIVCRYIAGRTLEVRQRIMPDSFRAPKYVASYVPAGAPMKPCAPLHGDGVPQGITVHNTEMITPAKGTDAAEQYTRATYNGNMNGVIVHYYVWHDQIWQLLDDHERGWHATDGSTRRLAKDGKAMIGGNLDTIAIEGIGPDMETETTVTLLCAWLCREYNLLPERDVYPHRYFYHSKYCPAYLLDHWEDFLLGVREAYLDSEKPQDEADAPSAWAAESWAWAKKMKYLDGTRPRDPVTREELAVVLMRVETDMD